MTLRSEFVLRRADDAIAYDGLHGPMTVVPSRDEEHSAVLGSRGESTIAWGRHSVDDRALETDGVAVHVAGAPSARLVRVDRTLELRAEDGAVQAVIRPRRFGRMRLERADGTELVTWRGTRGKVDERAGFADVALVLLVIVSRIAQRLERPVPTI